VQVVLFFLHIFIARLLRNPGYAPDYVIVKNANHRPTPHPLSHPAQTADHRCAQPTASAQYPRCLPPQTRAKAPRQPPISPAARAHGRPRCSSCQAGRIRRGRRAESERRAGGAFLRTKTRLAPIQGLEETLLGEKIRPRENVPQRDPKVLIHSGSAEASCSQQDY